MTIKPKKKVTKDKNDSETPDTHTTAGHPHQHGHGLAHGHGLYHHSGNTESRLEKPTRARTSPTRWIPSTSSRDELAHSHPALTQNLSANASYEFDGHETPNHKRRHRSSPHRTGRKHRSHASNVIPSAANVTGNSNSLSPLGGSVDDCGEDYNSEEEHSPPPAAPENIAELEQWFEQALKDKRGFLIKKMGEDGACLFRSVADQVYGDQEMHGIVRKHCLDYMSKNADFYSQYVTEDFTMYINRKRLDSCHGNHLEIQAITELFNRPVEVYQYSLEPMNTFDTAYKTDNPPIRLSYHGNVHYNSIVDPYSASIGVGLGLPGLQPGLAERNLMHEAIKSSENFHIEQTMLEDKLRETDWEVTQDSIEEQVARESYLQWLREQEKATRRTKGAAKTASATCSSSSDLTHSNIGETGPVRSPRQLRSGNSSPQQQHQAEDQFVSLPGSSKSPRHSPPQSSTGCASSTSVDGACAGLNETASIMNHLPPTMYGLSDWSEEDVLAQVIAQSQLEYLDSLKKRATGSSSSPHYPSTSASSSSAAYTGADVAGYSGASTSYSFNHNNHKHGGAKS
uniref:ubiquitinyl hydrolase 1 n=1 Tax=Arion vulgaris TaxID=1028688 RepID=A0A0B6YBP0_9EUPU